MTAQFGSVAIDVHDANWIHGSAPNAKQVLSAQFDEVLAGSIVDVRASGSGNGHFYYRIVETTGHAKDVGDSVRVHAVDGGWHAIETSSLFQVTATGPLNFAVQLDKVDMSGDHTIFNLTLIAKML